MPQTASHSYKEITLHQLRSLCETARLGSFAAAAESLGLSQPTVWNQVHALERQLEVKLVEPYARGCRLTEAGHILDELASPSLEGIGNIKRRFFEACGLAETQLVVATTPRLLFDDLPHCLHEFERRHPNIRLMFRERQDDQVPAEVEAGHADVGLAPDAGPPRSPNLVFEPCCECDLFLITPKNHPLARQRVVRPRDLLDYPFVNAPDGFGKTEITVRLENLGIFKVPASRVQACFATTIWRYVQLGFGIGLMGRTPVQPPFKDLHQRSMSRYFGKHTFYLMWRKDAPQLRAAEEFVKSIKMLLNRKAHKPDA